MKFKFCSIIVLSLVMVGSLLSVVACSNPTSDANTQSQSGTSSDQEQKSVEPITLKWSSIEPNTKSSTLDALHDFIADVEEQTEGRVTFEVYYGGVLGKMPDTTKMLRSGVADGATLITSYCQWEIPLYAAAGLPFLTTGYKVGPQATWELYQEWPAMQDEWEKAGMKPIWPFQPQPHWMGLTELIDSVSDLDGRKMWAGGFWPELMEEFNAITVPLTAPEAYDALQKGNVAGVVNPYHTFRSFRFYEVISTLVEWPFGGQPVNAFVLSMDAWNKISPDDQNTIMDIASGLREKHWAYMADEETVLTETFKDAGIEFMKLPGSDLEQIPEIGKDVVWNQWLETAESKGVPGQEFLDRYQEKTAKYK